MVNSHYNSDAFDAALELLASIPCWPRTARLKDLARDLGIASSQEVRTRIGRLRRMGLSLVEEAQPGGAVVAIGRQSWQRASEMSSEYWAKFETV